MIKAKIRENQSLKTPKWIDDILWIRLPHEDKSVPACLNDRWEIFVKWYYVFANFNPSRVSVAEAWELYFYSHPEIEKVWGFKRAADEANVKKLRLPVFKVVTPPKTGPIVSFADINRELQLLAEIHGLYRSDKKDEYKKLKNNLYKIYGQKP